MTGGVHLWYSKGVQFNTTFNGAIMTDLLKRHGVGLIWSVIVFTIAFFFYLLSAAFVPYLGLSTV